MVQQRKYDRPRITLAWERYPGKAFRDFCEDREFWVKEGLAKPDDPPVNYDHLCRIIDHKRRGIISEKQVQEERRLTVERLSAFRENLDLLEATVTGVIAMAAKAIKEGEAKFTKGGEAARAILNGVQVLAEIDKHTAPLSGIIDGDTPYGVEPEGAGPVLGRRPKRL